MPDMKKKHFKPYFFISIGIILLGACESHPEKVTDRPNILICIADDASYPYMSAYGSSWINTPGFDRVAKEGILFTNALYP